MKPYQKNPIGEDCSFELRNVQRLGKVEGLEDLISIFGLCDDQNQDAAPTGRDD